MIFDNCIQFALALDRFPRAMAETIFLSDADVAAACDWPHVIEAIRQAYSTPRR